MSTYSYNILYKIKKYRQVFFYLSLFMKTGFIATDAFQLKRHLFLASAVKELYAIDLTPRRGEAQHLGALQEIEDRSMSLCP